jgi:hypothetical protein
MLDDEQDVATRRKQAMPKGNLRMYGKERRETKPDPKHARPRILGPFWRSVPNAIRCHCRMAALIFAAVHHHGDSVCDMIVHHQMTMA